MTTFLENIIKSKEQEIHVMTTEQVGEKRKAPRFYETVKRLPNKMQLIAEIKRASPSKGDIQVEVDILTQAKRYESAGAAAISVLTDERYFKGSIEDLRKIAGVVTIPLLCKDFILAEKQIVRARNAGATIVLLIVAALSSRRLQQLYQFALELELEVLVEVHDANELAQAEALGANIIGVNNRNLHTFEVELRTSEVLGQQQKSQEAIYISESGIKNRADVERLAPYYQGVLVGEALMRAANPNIEVQKLKVAR